MHRPDSAGQPQRSAAHAACILKRPALSAVSWPRPSTEWKPWDVPAGYTVEILEETAVDAKLGGSTYSAPPTPPGV